MDFDIAIHLIDFPRGYKSRRLQSVFIVGIRRGGIFWTVKCLPGHHIRSGEDIGHETITMGFDDGGEMGLRVVLIADNYKLDADVRRGTKSVYRSCGEWRWDSSWSLNQWILNYLGMKMA